MIDSHSVPRNQLEAIKLGVLGNVQPKRILGSLKHAESRIK